MKKFLISLVIISLSTIAVLASDWRWIPGEDYIDLESITKYYGNALYPHTNSYTYWLKSFDDGSGENKYIEDNRKIMQNSQLTEIKTKEILDCANKKFAQSAKYFYDKAGNILFSYSLKDYELKWGEVVPDSNIEFIYKLLCQPNKQQ